MRIRSMTAVFGTLDNARLEPGPGLNLIHAPNEGGKSTWAAFWRAMLYGIDTRKQNKKGFLADKHRYQPWSGTPMEGELVLEWQGRDITIRRGPRGNTPFGAFSAVYTGTQEPVPGLTAANCGELLAGVGLEVFSRSAFLGAGNLAVTSAPELERRIAALVSSGEEDVSFSQAMERLKGWKNRRQVNKSVGEIPRLEGELDQVREALEQLEEVSAQVSRLEGEQAGLVQERDRLSRQLEAHRALDRRKLFERYAQAEEEYQAARRQLTALETERSAHPLPDREELKKAQGELQYIKVLDEEIRQGSSALEEAERQAAQAGEAARDNSFPDLTGDEAVAKAAADCAEYQAAQEKGRRYQRTCPWFIILGLVWLLGFSLPLFLKNGSNFFSGMGVILCVFCLLLACLQNIRVKKIRSKASEIFAPYSVQDPEELTMLAQNYRERCQKAGEVERQAQTIRTALQERKNRRDTSKADLLEFVHQFSPEVRDMFGCSAALSRALNLDHDLHLARERVEERRRRLEDLAAQGAGHGEAPAPDLPVPEQGPEETGRALTLAGRQLEQVSAQLNQAQGRQRAMGDPAALNARREELEERLALRRLELEALTAAMDALTQANTRLQERFSPELNRLSGQYMARLTGDKYSAVSLTRELEGFVQSGGVLPRSALYLSRGAADQLYLAVRLAVCRLCLPERPPILLDDALAAFDDQRLALALALLRELAQEQQILLFTCQKREGELLRGAAEVTELQL